MATTVGPELKPDRFEREDSPVYRTLAGTTRKQPAARSFDPTQGRRIGSGPYDDVTQGRRIGSNAYDDPTLTR